MLGTPKERAAAPGDARTWCRTACLCTDTFGGVRWEEQRRRETGSCSVLGFGWPRASSASWGLDSSRSLTVSSEAAVPTWVVRVLRPSWFVAIDALGSTLPASLSGLIFESLGGGRVYGNCTAGMCEGKGLEGGGV